MTIKVCKWCEQHYVGGVNDSGFCSIECETIFHEQEQYLSENKEAINDDTIKD